MSATLISILSLVVGACIGWIARGWAEDALQEDDDFTGGW